MEPRSTAATHGKCMTNSSSNSPVRKTTGHGSGIEQNDRQRTTSERPLTDGGVAVSDGTDAGPDPTVTWHGLNAFQRDCLRAVATLGEPKGLAVKERLETFYGEDVNHGRLYPNLDHLVDEGLVRKGTKDKRTNSYAVTEWGQTVLDARDDLLQGGVDR